MRSAVGITDDAAVVFVHDPCVRARRRRDALSHLRERRRLALEADSRLAHVRRVDRRARAASSSLASLTLAPDMFEGVAYAGVCETFVSEPAHAPVRLDPVFRCRDRPMDLPGVPSCEKVFEVECDVVVPAGVALVNEGVKGSHEGIPAFFVL